MTGYESPARRPRVVIFSMACSPFLGSEAGAGWGLTYSVMQFADCVVLTSSAFGDDVRRWKSANPDAPVEFVVVSEGSVAERLRFHRITEFSGYLFWLRRALAEARRIHRYAPFDVAFHATYSAYWLPSTVVDLGVPSVWGPVGGNMTTPLRLWPELGLPGILGEIMDWAAVRIARLLPATRRTWRTATVRLFNNEESRHAIPEDLARDSLVINNAPFVSVEPAPSRDREPYVVFASPLDPRKGPRLALRAFAQADPSLRMIFAAGGIEERPLRKLARELGIEGRVEFRGWIPRQEMFELLAGTRAAIFTGLREEGGVTLTEAMLHGAPVVVLDLGGAHAIVATATDSRRVAAVKPSSRTATVRSIARAIDEFCLHPVQATGPTIDQAAYHARLRDAFERALGRSIDTPGEARPSSPGVAEAH